MGRSVMVIAAHPDDAELGVGGIIACMTGAGHQVVLVNLTDGEPTPFGTSEIRRREAAEAAEVLGVQALRILDMKNCEISDTIENRKKIAAVIREFKPAILFVPYWEDAHPDHVAASSLSEAARFLAKIVKSDLPFEPHYAKKIFYYSSIHLRIKASPSFIYDISRNYDRKERAVLCYRSQFTDNPANSRVLADLKKQASFWGQRTGVEYGEALFGREYIGLSDPESLLNA